MDLYLKFTSIDSYGDIFMQLPSLWYLAELDLLEIMSNRNSTSISVIHK